MKKTHQSVFAKRKMSNMADFKSAGSQKYHFHSPYHSQHMGYIQGGYFFSHCL